eukprot:gnl/TRDRNA2_/TRDRNA2_176332_c0_seq9.p1 gnl/TRDRNA2_/TRDRNA2_176332_c0~~gnl/TRDRNA2_/TRDRNA2_176332_c0_seq9.p1  ORF type:complete len:334 (-),score=20.38 gnl/TRDRNA2_/TRDRNA2_176332_c0_seq9:42-1043(-)
MFAASVCIHLLLMSFQDSPVEALRLPSVHPVQSPSIKGMTHLHEEVGEAEDEQQTLLQTFSRSGVATASIEPKLAAISRCRGDGSLSHSSATSNANRTGVPTFGTCSAKLMARAAENCGGLGCRLVLVGDSILDRILSERCYRGAPHKNSSHYFSMIRKQVQIPESWRPLILAGSGDQTQHTLGHLNRTLPLLKTPQVFMVLIGTNNLGPPNCFSANQTAYGVRAVVELIRHRHPMSNILVHAILPRGEPHDNQPEIDETNAQLQAFYKSTSSHHLTRFIDCGTVFPHRADDDAGMKRLMRDYTHPTDEGYAKWFSCLRPLFARAMNESTSQW